MKDADRPIIISITAGAIVKAIVVCLLFWLLWTIRDLVLVMLVSIVIASAINPAATYFAKKRIPRIVSVLGIYLATILFFISMFSVFLPPFISDIQTVATQLPTYIESLSNYKFNNIPGFDILIETIKQTEITGDLIGKITTTFSGATLGFLTTASTVFGGALSFILIVVISFYLAVQEDGVRDFLRIITPIDKEKYVLDLWKRSQRKIGLWMQGQLLLAVIVGILTFIGLSVLGVPNPILLAVIAAVFELIPIFGPILAAIPAIAFALLGGGVTLGLLTLGLYVIIQQFESQLIHPLVVKKIVGIPALVAIVALIIGAQVAGFLGIVISVPIAAALMEFLGDIEKKKALINSQN